MECEKRKREKKASEGPAAQKRKEKEGLWANTRVTKKQLRQAETGEKNSPKRGKTLMEKTLPRKKRVT